MRDHYDFSKGERGKYAAQYAECAKLVLLDPDVAEHFKTAQDVNKALRELIKRKATDEANSA